MTIDHTGRATARQYWDCKPDRASTLTERDLSEDEAVAELTRLLKQSIARRMVSDVPFGVLLSGGVDSSLNVALMSELMTRPVTTFTIGYEGKEDYNEFQFARRVSQRYKTDHHETLISRPGGAGLSAAARAAAGRADRRQRLHPALFPRAARQAERHHGRAGRRGRRRELPRLLVVRALPAEIRVGLQAGAQRASGGGRRGARREGAHPGVSGEDLEIFNRAESAARSCSGAARSAGGARCAIALTPTPRRSAQPVECPVEGLLPDSHTLLDSHAVVREYLGRLDGRPRRARGAAEDSVHGDEAAAAGAPADARRQADDGACRRGARAVSRSRRRRVRDAAAAVLQAAGRRRQVASSRRRRRRISITT